MEAWIRKDLVPEFQKALQATFGSTGKSHVEWKKGVLSIFHGTDYEKIGLQDVQVRVEPLYNGAKTPTIKVRVTAWDAYREKVLFEGARSTNEGADSIANSVFKAVSL